MIDWGKYCVKNADKINLILADHNITWERGYNINTGEVKLYPIKGIWNVWKFEAKSPTWLEITGSLHKYWNNGTNETDFPFYDLYRAIYKLCKFLQVSPLDLTVHNLEFGGNIRPEVEASEIIRAIICFKNKIAAVPIDNEKGFYTQYKADEYYFKIYDKGKQAREKWHKECGNIMRIEIKAANSGFIQFANIHTLADLLNPNNLLLLGTRLHEFTKQIIFDDTVNMETMRNTDRKVYQKLCNPRVWVSNKKNKTSTIRAQEHRFREVVGEYGVYKHSSNISYLVKQKWADLLNCSEKESQEAQKYLDNCN